MIRCVGNRSRFTCACSKSMRRRKGGNVVKQRTDRERFKRVPACAKAARTAKAFVLLQQRRAYLIGGPEASKLEATNALQAVNLLIHELSEELGVDLLGGAEELVAAGQMEERSML